MITTRWLSSPAFRLWPFAVLTAIAYSLATEVFSFSEVEIDCLPMGASSNPALLPLPWPFVLCFRLAIPPARFPFRLDLGADLCATTGHRPSGPTTNGQTPLAACALLGWIRAPGSLLDITSRPYGQPKNHARPNLGRGGAFGYLPEPSPS